MARERANPDLSAFINARVSPADRAYLDDLAEHLETSLSDALRQAIEKARHWDHIFVGTTAEQAARRAAEIASRSVEDA